MSRALTPVLILIGIIAFLVGNTLFIVPQTQQALVLQLGTAVSVINDQSGRAGPGLYLKAPFVQNVLTFDKRNLGFNLSEQMIVASDQQRLVVDAFARWRIDDPLKFYQAVQTEAQGEARLNSMLTTSLRRALGGANQNEIISTKRTELMKQIAADMNAVAKRDNFGVSIIDVRIRQADLPQETAERVFERMRSERQQFAAELRAKGDEEAIKVRAEADRTVVTTLAEAREQSEKLRGQGDADRVRIFAQSFGRDPEFAAFYRSMQAYEKAMPKGTPMVVSPDGEFFRFMRDKDGVARR
jgi:modulator of FtsH protease HflC